MITYEKNQKTLPSFVTFSKIILQYTFYPIPSDIIKKYTIQVDLIDSMDAKSSYTFDITVKDANAEDEDGLVFAGVSD